MGGPFDASSLVRGPAALGPSPTRSRPRNSKPAGWPATSRPGDLLDINCCPSPSEGIVDYKLPAFHKPQPRRMLKAAPQCHSALSNNPISENPISISEVRVRRVPLQDYLFHPSYMANTELFRAKARSRH